MTALLELRGIRKSFGPLQAVDDVSISVEAGEVLSVVGENGAGKTTLMNVACGLYHPDSGEVFTRGEPTRLKGPRDAIARGVGMVHQHFMLVPTLTLAENITLGSEPREGVVFDRQRAISEVRAVSDKHGLALDPEALVEEVGVGMQQRAEIVKALYRRCDTLILDEPTAMLAPQESAELIEVLRRLAKSGKAVVLVSHRLKEVLSASDRIAVMRRGKLVAMTLPSETSATQLAELMVGHTAPSIGRPDSGAERVFPSPSPRGRGDALLAAKSLSARDDRGRLTLTDVSFELCAGEILGVAGVDGNGQSELVDVLTGMRPRVSGELSIGGTTVKQVTPREIRELGVAHVPEDRQRRGLLLPMTVAENIALGRHRAPPFARGMLIDRGGRDDRARQLVTEFDVRPPEIRIPVRSLSGGNQQKVILGRELDAGSRLLIAVQPTRGLDIGATGMVHQRLRQARGAGCGVLLVSLDLDEILELSDRILVIFKGRVAGILPRSQADETGVGRLMLGQGPAA
jgi:general nucleoside transport system ATP-binding protein